MRFKELLDGAPLIAPAPLPTRNQDLVTMIGAKDSKLVSYERLREVSVPDETYRENGNVSYAPVPYFKYADAVRSIFTDELDSFPEYETYALSNDEQQMFGKIVFPWSGTRGLSIGLRSSNDRSSSLQLAGGLDTFVCANGCFAGEAMMKLRHTAQVYQRLPGMIREMASRAAATAKVMSDSLDSWENIPMCDELFYSYLGILRGKGHINSMIMNTAFKYWDRSRNGRTGGVIEHGEENLASGFQAVTGGLQRSRPDSVFQQSAGVNYITECIAQSGGSIDTKIPAFDLQIEEY